MGLELLSAKARQPATWAITVGGRDLGNLDCFLVEARIELRREEAATGTLRFDTVRDERGEFRVLDDPAIRPWQPIKVEAAFGSRREEIVRGYIREVRASYPEDPGTTAVEVELQDTSLALDREHVCKVWGSEEKPTTDAAVVAEIAQKYNLSPKLGQGDGLTGLTLNQSSTDIRFLRERALANGYELILDRDELYFGPLRLSAEPQATIRVYAGPDTHCLHFDVSADGHRPDAVVWGAAPVTGTEPVKGEEKPDLDLLGREPATGAGAGLAPFAWRLDRQGTVSPAELAARARGLANEMALKVRAQGELDGTLYGHVLRIGRPVGVDGIGSTMGGLYYVDTVTHVLSCDFYRQAFTLLRNAYGDNLKPRASVLAGVV